MRLPILATERPLSPVIPVNNSRLNIRDFLGRENRIVLPKFSASGKPSKIQIEIDFGIYDQLFQFSLPS
jgi:hypothetical protein